MASGDPEHRIEDLFHAALQLPHGERTAFLRGACGDDTALRREIEDLLVIDERDSDDLAPPIRRPEVQIPHAIGPYQVLREIAHGGMGTVYLAQQETPVRREVAVKLMNSRFDDKELMARFAAERQASALMQHPGIVKILDAGCADDGRPYYVMEYVDGLPIVQHCVQHNLSLPQRVRIHASVCRAVHHAHQKGVIHRDLKPSNILIERTGERTDDAQPKVIDFGVAKGVDTELSPTSMLTVDGTLVGTPEYMSPEQASGNTQDLDTRSDIYSLGVILHELLTGRRPFVNTANRLELLRAIREDEPRRPSASCPSVPRELDWITLRALEKDPNRRYHSASELAADLERFLRNEAVEAGPPSSLYRLRKLASRHRGLVAGTAIGFVALLLGLVVALWQFDVARTNAIVAERNLGEYRRMADVRRAKDLLHQAETELWPPRPALVDALRAWIGQARELTAKRASVVVRIDELDRLLEGEQDAGFDKAELEWQRDTLTDLVSDLDALVDSDRLGATIESVTWRLRTAESVQARTIDAHRAAWDAAIASIADTTQCPQYSGLRLTPQPGLVPLGRNPRSELWEFWHVASGARPEWSADGSVRLSRDSGVVLVLVPGGSFFMGAEKPATGKGYGPNIDPHSGHVSVPVHRITLAPFFLSRFEMTQGQWLAWSGENPARLTPGQRIRGKTSTWTNPVERVTWTKCARFLRQMGLALPTEAQWEYACRAGSRTVFEPGNRLGAVMNRANLADEASRAMYPPNWLCDPDTDDGYALHAPVGSFAPNAWGLHDMHGNVLEWCRDRFGAYTLPTRPGDGLRLVPPATVASRIARGGCFYMPAINARCAERHQYRSENTPGFAGVRPARAVETAVEIRTKTGEEFR